MIRISQLKMPVCHTDRQLEQKIQKLLKLPAAKEFTYRIAKKSIDARKKPDLIYVYTIDVEISDEQQTIKKIRNKNIAHFVPKDYQIPGVKTDAHPQRPVIIGTGPAGLFCAYALVLAGIKPVLIERGKCAGERTKDVERFWKSGILDTDSNVQFGEGGAGTFSDGKLNTLVKDPVGRNRFVLETLVKFGSPEEILYENKPHIGTDILTKVIVNMRKEMEEAGAVYRFSTCMTDYRTKDGRLSGIELNHEEWMDTDCMVLAVGHSARDTFRMLSKKAELAMEAKPFAVGFRVEHPQAGINLLQYGERYGKDLPAASYKAAVTPAGGRGVYTFCMCPGGYVVNASSEEKRLAVNGMSYAGRDGKNANSAIIVSVGANDFDGSDALSGMRFQEKLEERAYLLCGGKIPQQLFGDYIKNIPSTAYGAFESQTKGAAELCNLRGLLPQEIEHSFIWGMQRLSQQMIDFDRPDAILSGIESRTSSPVRISRNAAFMADIIGIYPCGEGAGYAGGIMSAAMDGLKVAEAILKR